jgi:hypothetical protein
VRIFLFFILFVSLSGCWHQNILPWHGIHHKRAADVRWKAVEGEELEAWLNGQAKGIPRLILSYSKGDKSTAEHIVKELDLTLHALYSDFVQPYPGAVTNQVKCSKDDLFTSFKDPGHTPAIIGYWLNANSRWVAAGCNGADKKYLAFFGVLSCPRQESVFNFKIYFESMNLEKAKEFVLGFQCE